MSPRTLARVHRVRTLQVGLARADEAQRLDALAEAASLEARIAGLVSAVSPAPEVAGARTLAAAAYYRERLHHSATAAVGRVRVAEDRAAAAAEASRVAERDRKAVEKLLGRARADAVLAAMRALADAPPTRSKRHGPC